MRLCLQLAAALLGFRQGLPQFALLFIGGACVFAGGGLQLRPHGRQGATGLERLLLGRRLGFGHGILVQGPQRSQQLLGSSCSRLCSAHTLGGVCQLVLALPRDVDHLLARSGKRSGTRPGLRFRLRGQ